MTKPSLLYDSYGSCPAYGPTIGCMCFAKFFLAPFAFVVTTSGVFCTHNAMPQPLLLLLLLPPPLSGARTNSHNATPPPRCCLSVA